MKIWKSYSVRGKTFLKQDSKQRQQLLDLKRLKISKDETKNWNIEAIFLFFFI